MKPKLTSQISVKLSKDAFDALNEIKRVHRIDPTELLRGLVDAAVLTYKKHKRFTFPIVVAPTPFPSFQFVGDFFDEHVGGEKGWALTLALMEAIQKETPQPALDSQSTAPFEDVEKKTTRRSK